MRAGVEHIAGVKASRGWWWVLVKKSSGRVLDALDLAFSESVRFQRSEGPSGTKTG